MIFFLSLWLALIIATGIIAQEKHLSVIGFVLMAVFFGPLAFIPLILVLALPSRTSLKKPHLEIQHIQDAQGQLNILKDSLLSLQKRIADLEAVIKSISQAPAPVEAPSEQAVSAKESQGLAAPIAESRGASVVEAEGKEEFEFVFGKYWLNRIGVILFFLGVAFFIGYTFTYLNALAKISIGYLCTFAFFSGVTI